MTVEDLEIPLNATIRLGLSMISKEILSPMVMYPICTDPQHICVADKNLNQEDAEGV
jgi:hypothetical protein